MRPMAVVGALVITDISESEVRLRWDDVYTISSSETVETFIEDEELLLRENVRPKAPLEIQDFFSRLGWMQDVLVDGRKLLIEDAPIKVVEWSGPETAAIEDSGTPSLDLVTGAETWLTSDAGFVDNGFALDEPFPLGSHAKPNYVRPIADDILLCVTVTPRFFRMENVHVRQPVMVHVGIVHRRLNEFTDWIGSRPHRPWRWSLHEPVGFFNPDGQMVWHPDTPLDQIIGEVGVALEAAAKLANPDVLAEFLWRCLLYTSPSPRDRTRSRMPSSA